MHKMNYTCKLETACLAGISRQSCVDGDNAILSIINCMSCWMESLDKSVLTVILGDFNYDLLDSPEHNIDSPDG